MDLLHVFYITYLTYAASYIDKLLVLINTLMRKLIENEIHYIKTQRAILYMFYNLCYKIVKLGM